MTGWVYVLGEVNGEDLKVGYTSRSAAARRATEVTEREWHGERDYVLLVAVRGTPIHEKAILRAFRVRTDCGNRKENIWPDDDAVGYVNWLRSKWFVSGDGMDHAEGFPVEDPDSWLPAPGRYHGRPPPKMVLFSDSVFRTDHLAGTAWDWMMDPSMKSAADFFTPPEIVEAAREAMGDIDLDAAGHWIANKKFHIPEFFYPGRDAFKNRWFGRVWLNPPRGHGEGERWLGEAVRYVDSGDVEQICILTPTWSIPTRAGQEVMARISSLMIFAQAPKFWGHEQERNGTNHAQVILYIGHREKAFARAFAPFGNVSFPAREFGE